jgi:hypothetical protein
MAPAAKALPVRPALTANPKGQSVNLFLSLLVYLDQKEGKCSFWGYNQLLIKAAEHPISRARHASILKTCGEPLTGIQDCASDEAQILMGNSEGASDGTFSSSLSDRH